MGEEQYIEELREYLVHDVYAKRDAEIRENRKARWGEDITIADIPDAYRASTQLVVLPRNQDTLQRMVSLVTNDDPAISQPPSANTDDARRRANMTERWAGGAFRKAGEDAGRDCWRQAIDAALGDGMGVLKSCYRPSAWSDEPTRGKGEDGEPEDAKAYLARVNDYRKGAPFPLTLEDVDLLTYYPVREGGHVTEVLEICKRPLIPTLRALNVKASASGSKRSYKKLRKGERFPVDGGIGGGRASCEVIEDWTANEIKYFIDGALVDTLQHDTGRVPYFEVPGYTTSSRDPDKAARSAISGMRSLVKNLNRWLTIMSNLGYLNGYPYLVEGDTDMPGMLPNQTTVQQIVPGSVLARGTKFLEVPGVSKDVQNMISLLQAEADRSGLTAVMYGSNGGASSGYQVASLQAAAQSVLKPVVRNAGAAIAEILRYWLRIVDTRIKTNVPIWGAGVKKGQNSWLSLGPDDIQGYYVINAELRPLLPLDEIAQRDSALRMHEGGLWPARYALEKTGEEQPEDLLDELWAEKAMERPAISEGLMLDAAEKQGILKRAAPALPPLGPGGPMAPLGPGDAGGPGMPGSGPIQVPVPGAGMPLVPPGPAGVGGPPQGVPRAPGGNFRPGPVGVP